MPCSINTYNPHPEAYQVTSCLRCPERTSTLGASGALGIDNCSCTSLSYKAPLEHAVGRDSCLLDDTVTNASYACCACPIGTLCDHEGISIEALRLHNGIQLESIPIKRGYYRRSMFDVDVRRCPDASANCTGQSECENSASGCFGSGDDRNALNQSGGDALCRQNLTGIFCRRCVNPNEYYVLATNGQAAHCIPCSEVSSTTFIAAVGTVGLVCIGLGLIVFVIRVGFARRLPRTIKLLAMASRKIRKLLIKYSLPQKLKIIIGFYQIATQVESVYDLFLPSDVRELLRRLRFAISLGIDAIPLECMGAAGYVPRLWFWSISPLAIIFVGAVGGVIKVLLVDRDCSRQQIIANVLPTVLRIIFLLYPVVTTVSFEACASTQP